MRTSAICLLRQEPARAWCGHYVPRDRLTDDRRKVTCMACLAAASKERERIGLDPSGYSHQQVIGGR